MTKPPQLIINTIEKSTPKAESQMQLAIAECSEYDEPNYSAIAVKFPPVNQYSVM